METMLAVLMVLGVYIMLPAIIGFIIVGSFMLWEHWAIRKVAHVEKQASQPLMVCSTDADCPLGYVCMGGRCVPVTEAETITSPFLSSSVR
jgi:hypothetical protein